MSTLLVACSGFAGSPQTVAVIIDTYDKFGNLGKWYDAEAGVWKPYPMSIPVRSPWTHSLTVLPGETAAVDVEATLFGPVGEYISCSVYVDGELAEDVLESRIVAYDNLPVESPINKSGSATVRCAYTLSTPG